MTTTYTGDFYASGAHRARFILLDKTGRPVFTTAAPSTPYAGVDFRGMHKWDIPNVKMNIITHMDNDAPVHTQQLPPKELPACTLTTGINSMDINAQLQGVKKITIGQMHAVNYLTDMMGFSPAVGLFLSRWAIDDETSVQAWEWVMCPSAVVAPQPNSWSDVAQEKSFDVALNKSRKYLYGVPLTVAADGCLESAYLDGESAGEPIIQLWNADGTEDNFKFMDENGNPLTAANTTCITVWDYDSGVPITSGITKTVNDLTFLYPPAAGHLLIAMLELA